MTGGGNMIQGTLVYKGPTSPRSAGVRETIKGYCLDLPAKGSRFRLFYDTRHMDTSTVQRIDKMLDGALLVVTENSVYEWRGEAV